MGQTNTNNRLEDLLNLERLQTLQNNLAGALELAFVTVDYRGCPVTESSGFSDFCRCMRSHEKYGHLCNQCYAHGGLRATISGEPWMYRCHAGLVEFAIPLMLEGKYLGTLTGGQCVPAEEAPELEPVLPQSTPWEQEPELARLRGSVYKASCEKLKASVCLVQDILHNLLREEQGRLVREELSNKNRELLEEKAARVNLELAMKEEAVSEGFVEKLDSEHLFYMLNVISRLAFLENAEETERTACDFAAMMRYVLENGEYRYVTLGEELEYTDYYLRIQQRRMEGRLHYEILVPENCHSTLCPFMLLHPLVRSSVEQMLENSRDGATLQIRAGAERELLVVTISCLYAGFTGQRQDLEEKRMEESLSRIDRSLKTVLGKNCGVSVENRADGLPGNEIHLRLPLNGAITEG